MKKLIIVSIVLAYSSFLQAFTLTGFESRYILKKGDTISQVLNNEGFKHIYEKNGPLEETLSLNNLTMQTARNLKVGTEILLPANWSKVASQVEQGKITPAEPSMMPVPIPEESPFQTAEEGPEDAMPDSEQFEDPGINITEENISEDEQNTNEIFNKAESLEKAIAPYENGESLAPQSFEEVHSESEDTLEEIKEEPLPEKRTISSGENKAETSRVEEEIPTRWNEDGGFEEELPSEFEEEDLGLDLELENSAEFP